MALAIRGPGLHFTTLSLWEGLMCSCPLRGHPPASTDTSPAHQIRTPSPSTRRRGALPSAVCTEGWLLLLPGHRDEEVRRSSGDAACRQSSWTAFALPLLMGTDPPLGLVSPPNLHRFSSLSYRIPDLPCGRRTEAPATCGHGRITFWAPSAPPVQAMPVLSLVVVKM